MCRFPRGTKARVPNSSFGESPIFFCLLPPLIQEKAKEPNFPALVECSKGTVWRRGYEKTICDRGPGNLRAAAAGKGQARLRKRRVDAHGFFVLRVCGERQQNPGGRDFGHRRSAQKNARTALPGIHATNGPYHLPH